MKFLYHLIGRPLLFVMICLLMAGAAHAAENPWVAPDKKVESSKLEKKPAVGEDETKGQAVESKPALPLKKTTASGLERATVTLPYEEVKRLWEVSQDAAAKKAGNGEGEQPQPPVAALLRSAHYELAVQGRDLALHAEFHAENLDSRQWQRVPLLNGGFSLTDVQPAEARVVRDDAGYALLLPPSESVDLKLTLSAPSALPEGWWMEQALPEFIPAAAAVRTLTWVGESAPKAAKEEASKAESELKLSIGSVEWPKAPAGADGRGLSPVEIALQWSVTRTDPGMVAEAERKAMQSVPTAVPWQLRSEMVVKFQEGRLVFQIEVHARTDEEQGGRMMHLVLPASARGILAESENLIRQRELPREKAGDPRRLELLWSDLDRAEREVSVTFSVAQSPLADTWALPLPTSLPAAESTALAVVGVSEGLEISGDGVRAATGLAGLPKWMVELLGGSDFVSMDVADAAGASVDVRWLPRVNTAAAVVAEARAVTRVVADGALLNHAEYIIEHDEPLHWTLSLPAGSELLSASINGTATRPVQRDESTLELQLPQPSKSSSDVAAHSTVQLTYAGGVQAFDPVSGSIELSLPDTPLFVHRLLWDVHIPERYETSAIDGNIAIDSTREHCELGSREQGKSETKAIQLRKELIRNEDSPTVEIFYRSTLAGN